MESVLTVLTDQFENGDTGEISTGVTVIVDGAIKMAMDRILQADSSYNGYLNITKDALMLGLAKRLRQTEQN